MKPRAMVGAMAATLALAGGCAPRAVPQALPEPPPELTSCRQDGFAPPAPLPRLRTIEHVAKWAASTELARQRTQAELMNCARRLDSLHQWIEDHRAAS
jgi:hypothetical protein